ncbi:uncharacterized protein LOC127712300 [Mytilus californianus]|uniref:uncharacterized protein LOC127712300 n=1 Tax=Mytilus californianus TaxID=6549 RepID=UPI00224587F4|nr:uncharacterized protein LOC127712300 [Mytilus californianus]
MASKDNVNRSVGDGLSPEEFLPDPPSEDWELNILLDDIAQGIPEEDLKRLKSYCIGGPGKRTLSEMKDAIDLFTHLRQTRRLTKDNLIVLQSMLFHLHRRDLQKKVVEYARRLGNVLHFYTPSDQPENGYQHLTIHVEGTVNFDRIKLEKLRDGVARLLCIPPQFVVVNGIEPGNSFLITFTIAEEYIDFVFEMQQGDAAFLIAEGVDFFKVNEKVVDLKNLQKEQSTEDVLAIKHEMQSFAKRIQNLESDLDDAQAQMIKVERERKMYKTENSIFKQTCKTNAFIATMVQALWYYVLFLKIFKPFERLSTKAACVYFHVMLKETQRLNYDSNVLRALIEANAMMIKAKVSEDMCIRLSKYNIQLQAMASKINFLEYEKEKLAFYLNIGENAPILSQREEFWLRTLERSFIPAGMPISGVISATIGISDPDLQIILTKLSKELTKKERNKLLQGLPDGEKRRIEKTPNALLQALWEKEKRRSKGQTKLDIWFHAIMKDINRQDLNNPFLEMVQSTMIQGPSEDKKPKMSSSSSRSSGLHKSLGRRKRRRFNSGPGTSGIIHTDSDQSSGFCEMEQEGESSFTQFQILNKQMHKMQTALETLTMRSKEEYQFSPFTKDTESAFSSIPSYISKPKT